MIKKLLLSVLLTATFAITQEPIVEWQKSFGGSLEDWSRSIEQTNDGGYIAAGTSQSIDGDVTANNGYFDFWVVKVDASGNLEWQKALGGSDSDWAWSVQQTNDNNYIVAGFSESSDGDVSISYGGKDCWIVKLDQSGNILWEKSYGGSDDDVARSIKQTSDGGFIVAGHTFSNDLDVTNNYGYSDIWILKIDISGNIIWEKSIGGSSHEEAYSIQTTLDNGFVIAGWTRSIDGDIAVNNGYYDCWVIKLNDLGDIIWEKNLGGSGDDRANSILQNTDGSYLVTGRSKSDDNDVSINQGQNDYWVVKLNILGEIIWEKSLGGFYNDYGYSATQTVDDGYIICGFTSSSDGDVTANLPGDDVWIVKLNEFGDIEWQKSLGGSNHDYAESIISVSDGGFVITGFSESMDGDLSQNSGEKDYWIIKIGQETSSLPKKSMDVVDVYPNPASDVFNIRFEKQRNSDFKILDILGRPVMKGRVESEEININISSLSKGLYHIQFDDLELPTITVMKK